MRKRAVDLSLEELTAMGVGAASAAAQRAYEAGVRVGDTANASRRKNALPPLRKLREILASLEECQEALVVNGASDTAQLVSVALLELRIKLDPIDGAELKALCDAMLRQAKASDLASPPTKELHEVLATLEENQAALVESGDRDAAQLVSVAVLELRIKLDRIGDTELKALCHAMLREAKDSGFEAELARSFAMSRVITLSSARK